MPGQTGIRGLYSGKVWRPGFKSLRVGAYGLIGRSARPTPGPSRNLRGLAMNIENLPGEEWRPVVGFETLYEVSSMGRVRSFPRVKWNGKVDYTLPARIMGQQDNGRGYKAVSLCRAGKNYSIVYVHRVVSHAFLDAPPPSIPNPEVNHIDGNKANNRLENLEWCSSSGNKKHARALGLYSRRQEMDRIASYAVVAVCVATGEVHRIPTLRKTAAFVGRVGHNGLLEQIRKSPNNVYRGFQFSITRHDGTSVL